MDSYLLLLASLVTLLLGLAAGKLWERYRLRGGRWIDRRRLRESLHYILGLDFLVTNQLDLAIEELSKAAANLGEAFEVNLLLGSLYREKGQVSRAITIHQTLLQRPKLTRLEHAHVLLCLGLDFKHGGFVDRALEAFTEVLRLDPGNQYALINIEKLHEDQHQWKEAFEIRQSLGTQASGEERASSQAILAFLENEIGLQALKRGDHAEAARRFRAAIDLDARVVPAYLNLGDVCLLEDKPAEAAAIWEQVIQNVPERAYLAFDRLAGVYPKMGAPERFPQLCRRLIAETPQDWRARLALARHLDAAGRSADALGLLFEALEYHPHALSLHQAIWQVLSRLQFERRLVQQYVDLTDHAVFYVDPHVCVRCRYRSTELLWQCPHCHEWNTFVEERIAPAKAHEEAGV